MAHSLKLNDEETVAFNILYPKWEQIPHSIRPDEDSLRLAVTDYAAESRILENVLHGNLAEKKPAIHFSLQQGKQLQPFRIEDLSDKGTTMAFSNAITRLKMAGLDPIQDLKEFGLDEKSVCNPTYLAANLFVALPLLADCLHMTFTETERFPVFGYEVLSVELHLDNNVGLKDVTPFWKSTNLGSLVSSIMKKLPPGSTTTKELVKPLKDLLAMAKKDTFVHYLSQVTLTQLKKKSLLLSEKAVQGLKRSIVGATENLFRERYLMVPYPRNRTLDLLYSRKTLRNNIIVRPPVLCSNDAPNMHRKIQQAITTQKLGLYSSGQLLFKEQVGECAMRLPTLSDVKKAIVREGLCTAHSYDLFVLQIATIEYDQRIRTQVPFSSIPYEYLVACQRLFHDSWIDKLIALKLKRMLNGEVSMLGDGDIKSLDNPFFNPCGCVLRSTKR
ncbi:hypothetical protein K7432_008425 [Basidiobolus ranarum]|uniref:Uncharacterized protein n=1 Tax=Basidiobolus ranarum TaxID=34480 RepID=A0ABR2VYZ9_9FUNG